MRTRGVTLGVVFFARHRTPVPFDEDDLLLAEEITVRAAVCVDNARCYKRERMTARALQRNLLPRGLPDLAAVEVPSRYLPSETWAGVGGDWFDVIPFSGARAALVVGDTVSRGVEASATMGRLRSAIRTLADIDLPPGELLTHLADLVTRLAAEDDPEPPGATGATCLYAVYDPVSRHCTLASAGHPPPVVVTADGSADILDVPNGPPLGLGTLPFEAVGTELSEGSVLALYTDGLVEGHGRAIDEGLEALCEALAQPGPSPDALGDTADSAPRPPRRRCRPAPGPRPGPRPRPGRHLGDPPGTRRRLPDPAGGHRPTDGLGTVEAGPHHRAGRQRTGHQRDPLRPPAHPAAPDPRPRAHLRGLRLQQHGTASAPGPRP
uniref:PP2C family protein-serine/threonine phosphatase n=1 Tax=Streptomyces rugosispiralis TaxID=2967341 RepID=UPI0027E3CBDF|nr:PP2C family protein-serine/threonine phosphatase [Streptomyces rugosispiralis]